MTGSAPHGPFRRSSSTAASVRPLPDSSSRTAAAWSSQAPARSAAPTKRTGAFRCRAVASIFERKKRSSTQAIRVLPMDQPILYGWGAGRSEHLHEVDRHPVDPVVQIELLLPDERRLDVDERRDRIGDADAVALRPGVPPPVVRVVRPDDGIAPYVLVGEEGPPVSLRADVAHGGRGLVGVRARSHSAEVV